MKLHRLVLTKSFDLKRGRPRETERARIERQARAAGVPDDVIIEMLKNYDNGEPTE